MFFTRVLNAIKSKYVLVELESTVTGYKKQIARLRRADKLEVIDLDPLIRQNVVFKETKKVASLDKYFVDDEWKEVDRKPIPSWALRAYRGLITSSD